MQIAELKKQYQTLCPGGKSDFFKKFPYTEYWRFYVEEYREQKGNGIVDFEKKELGYFDALLRHRVRSLFLKSNRVTVDEIKKNHQEITQDVNFNRPLTKGSFRMKNGLLGLRGLTEDGLYEIEQDLKNGKIGANTLSYSKFSGYILKIPFQQPLDDLVNSLLENYYETIEVACDDEKKLECIIQLITRLERLHPFQDANCRTFCMDLFNQLLTDNGFPPAILSDPNRFDGYSIQQLKEEVLNGMGRSLKFLSNDNYRKEAMLETKSVLVSGGFHVQKTRIILEKIRWVQEFYDEIIKLQNKEADQLTLENPDKEILLEFLLTLCWRVLPEIKDTLREKVESYLSNNLFALIKTKDDLGLLLSHVDGKMAQSIIERIDNSDNGALIFWFIQIKKEDRDAGNLFFLPDSSLSKRTQNLLLLSKNVINLLTGNELNSFFKAVRILENKKITMNHHGINLLLTSEKVRKFVIDNHDILCGDVLGAVVKLPLNLLTQDQLNLMEINIQFCSGVIKLQKIIEDVLINLKSSPQKYQLAETYAEKIYLPKIFNYWEQYCKKDITNEMLLQNVEKENTDYCTQVLDKDRNELAKIIRSFLKRVSEFFEALVLGTVHYEQDKSHFFYYKTNSAKKISKVKDALSALKEDEQQAVDDERPSNKR